MTAHQTSVDEYFTSETKQWEEIYSSDSLYARIHQERRSIVLSMADSIALPAEARVLDVGCGAGLATVALAQRGFVVEAVDSVRSMLLATRSRAASAGVANRVRLAQARINHLPYPDNHFSLVLAIGVLPWIDCIHEAMKEIIRVASPGGFLIVNVDNLWRLHEVLDPRRSPLHAGVRRYLRDRFKLSPREPQTQRCSPREFDRLIREFGCIKVKAKMLGFGPLSFFGRPLFAESLNIKIHKFLQTYADQRFPIIRSVGAQYIALFRKSEGTS